MADPCQIWDDDQVDLYLLSHYKTYVLSILPLFGFGFVGQLVNFEPIGCGFDSRPHSTFSPHYCFCLQG